MKLGNGLTEESSVETPAAKRPKFSDEVAKALQTTPPPVANPLVIPVFF